MRNKRVVHEGGSIFGGGGNVECDEQILGWGEWNYSFAEEMEHNLQGGGAVFWHHQEELPGETESERWLRL